MKYLGVFFVAMGLSGVGYSQTQTVYQNTPYDLRIQTLRVKGMGLSSDKALITMETTVLFYVNASDVPQLHATLGPRYAEGIVPDIVSAEIGAVLAKFTFLDTQSFHREEMVNTLVTNVHKRLSEYRIQLKGIHLTSLSLPRMLQAAIEQKLAAKQELEVAKNRHQGAEMELAHRRKEVEAQAKINAIISQGLDARLLQLKYIEALEKLAASPQSKVVVFGNGHVSLPPFTEPKHPKK